MKYTNRVAVLHNCVSDKLTLQPVDYVRFIPVDAQHRFILNTRNYFQVHGPLSSFVQFEFFQNILDIRRIVEGSRQWVEDTFRFDVQLVPQLKNVAIKLANICAMRTILALEAHTYGDVINVRTAAVVI